MKKTFLSPCHQTTSKLYSSNWKGPLVVRYRQCTTCGQRFVTRQYNGKEHLVRFCIPRTPLTTLSFRRHDPQALRRLEAMAIQRGTKNSRPCTICCDIMNFGSSPTCLHCDNPRTEMEIYDKRFLIKISNEYGSRGEIASPVLSEDNEETT